MNPRNKCVKRHTICDYSMMAINRILTYNGVDVGMPLKRVASPSRETRLWASPSPQNDMLLWQKWHDSRTWCMGMPVVRLSLHIILTSHNVTRSGPWRLTRTITLNYSVFCFWSMMRKPISAFKSFSSITVIVVRVHFWTLWPGHGKLVSLIIEADTSVYAGSHNKLVSDHYKNGSLFVDSWWLSKWRNSGPFGPLKGGSILSIKWSRVHKFWPVYPILHF
jgi:hypothetical protein